MASVPTTWFERFRHSNRLAVFIVYATLMIDNMLLTSVVPILPEYFFKENGDKVSDSTISSQETSATSNPVTTSSSMQDFTNETAMESEEGCVQKRRKEFLVAENVFLAFLLASKPLVQAMANVVVGPLSDKVGYDVPMFAGYVVLITSSIIFAFGTTYEVLFVARALQGIGSACAATSGMAMLAHRYSDDEERGKMLGVALGGLAMGVLVGPTFASVTYQFAGKKTPFLILGGAAFLIALLQLVARQFHVNDSQHKKLKSSILKLLKDPYILLAASALTLGNMGIGVLETGLPTWMMTTMCAEEWMLGAACLPISFAYLIVTMVIARVATPGTRWLICMMSYFAAAVGCITLPFCKTFLQLIGPGIFIGAAVGMVDVTIFPIMGHLADTRHTAIYGSVYAIADAAFCAAFVGGPLLAGTVIYEIGFRWVMIIVAILNVAFAPLVSFLRDPPSISEEEMVIINKDFNRVDGAVAYDPSTSSIGRIMDTHEEYEELR